MLVSHSKKFIYIKTVKTAGTSVEVALQDLCMPPNGKLVKKDRASEAHISEYGIVGARGLGSKEEKWYNHMPAQKIREYLPEETWANYTKICNIRNPWDKVVSWFHFRNKDVKNLPKAEILKSFRSFMKPEDGAKPSVGNDTKIYFIDSVPVADEYIRYETLNEDYDRICKKLSIDANPLPELKRAERGKDTLHYKNYYDAELRDMVAEMFSKEIETFGWSF